MSKLFSVVILALFIFLCFKSFTFVLTVLLRIPFWVWVIAILLVLAQSRD